VKDEPAFPPDVPEHGSTQFVHEKYFKKSRPEIKDGNIITYQLPEVSCLGSSNSRKF